MRGERGAVVDECEHVVEAGLAELELAQGCRCEFGGPAVGRKHADARGVGGRGVFGGVTFGERRRDEGDGGAGVDEKMIRAVAVPLGFNDEEVADGFRGDDDEFLAEGGAAGARWGAAKRRRKRVEGSAAGEEQAGDTEQEAGDGGQAGEGRSCDVDSRLLSPVTCFHLTGWGRRWLRTQATADKMAAETKRAREPNSQNTVPARIGVMARESEPRERKIPRMRPCSAAVA